MDKIIINTLLFTLTSSVLVLSRIIYWQYQKIKDIKHQNTLLRRVLGWDEDVKDRKLQDLYLEFRDKHATRYK